MMAVLFSLVSLMLQGCVVSVENPVINVKKKSFQENINRITSNSENRFENSITNFDNTTLMQFSCNQHGWNLKNNKYTNKYISEAKTRGLKCEDFQTQIIALEKRNSTPKTNIKASKKIILDQIELTEIRCSGQSILSDNQNFNVPYFDKESFNLKEMLKDGEIYFVSHGDIEWKSFDGSETFVLSKKGNLKSKTWVAKYCKDTNYETISIYKLFQELSVALNKLDGNINLGNESNIVAIGDKKFKMSINRKEDNNEKVGSIKNTTTSASLNACSKLQDKVLYHIDNDNFDKASSARKLMKEMGCSSNANNTLNNSAQKKYTSSELNCNVGPLGKFLWAEFGKYSATAYNDNPPKSCLITYDYCKSRARAIAKGANIPPSEKSPDSYSANCNIYGSANKSVNCNVRPNSGAGGFTGGLANSLSKGIDEASRKQDIYVSNFELCMTEMGFQLSKR